MSNYGKRRLESNANFIAAEYTLFFVSVLQTFLSSARAPKSENFIPHFLSMLFVVSLIIVKLAYSAFLWIETERIDGINQDEQEVIIQQNKLAQKSYLIVTGLYMNVYTLLLIFLLFYPQYAHTTRPIVATIPFAYCLFIIKFKKQFPKVCYKYKKLFVKGMNGPFIFIYAYLICRGDYTVLSMLFLTLVYLFLITMPFLTQKLIMWETR
jgi:hypothetical protein